MAIVNNVLAGCDYPETAYKRAMGIVQLHRAYGSQRLNNACEKALFAGTCSYKRISNILKNNLDSVPILTEKKMSRIFRNTATYVGHQLLINTKILFL